MTYGGLREVMATLRQSAALASANALREALEDMVWQFGYRGVSERQHRNKRRGPDGVLR